MRCGVAEVVTVGRRYDVLAVRRKRLMARLRSEAITRSAFPVLTSDLSSR